MSAFDSITEGMEARISALEAENARLREALEKVEWSGEVLTDEGRAMRQCRDAGVPCFVKQLGAYSFDGSAPLPMTATAPCGLKEIENRIALKHSKGADPSEWPEDLRVQELAWEVGR